MKHDLHGIIFAYQANPELKELTQHRNTCSIPYGGRYRMVDFMLSNMVNAGITDIGLIVHQRYQSMLDHVGAGKDWDLSRKWGGLKILPPFSYSRGGNTADGGAYKGHMDALAGVRSYLDKIRQDYVVLATGALAVNFDLQDAFAHHLASGADMTAVCSHTAKCNPKETIYFEVDNNNMVTDVLVHPTKATGVEALDVYILSKALLLDMVDRCAAKGQASFGYDVLLGMRELKISAWYYDGFAARLQSVPGYFAQNMELLKPQVRADLFFPGRPIRTKDQSNPSTIYGAEAKSVNSLIADGCVIEGTVINSILSRGVKVAKGATVENCILMQRTEIQEGAAIHYAITDKNVKVGPGRTLMGHETSPLVIAKDEII